MLEELHVRNLALIREARLELGKGLTVLTGETGAGKTALLGACKLLIGERGDAHLVHAGSEEARVEARFFALEDGAEQQEHIVVRRLTKDGRSRCSLDDSMVTVGSLADKIGPLVDLYGQHDHQSLLKTSVQRDVLDGFAGAGLTVALAEYRIAFLAHRDACQSLEHLNALAHDASLQREQANFVLREIASANPVPGEYEALEDQLPRLRHAGELAEGIQQVLASLRGEQGVVDALATVEQTLAQLADIDTQLAQSSSAFAEVTVTLEELSHELRSYADNLEFDPSVLDAALERLAALDGLARRFGPRMEDVFLAYSNAQSLLIDTDDLQGKIAKAEQNELAARDCLSAAAQELSALRHQTAPLFSQKLSEAAQNLAMPDAKFGVELTALEQTAWTLDGAETAEIRYAPTAGQPLRPLAKIASGGELSRVMLAIKSLGHEEDSGVTLVFDEIDAGIGGATALSVAKQLRRLATRHQVLVVTHLAQIAAVADDHWVVAKQELDGQMASTISRVCGDERVDEIARMLAGKVDSVSRDHAIKLLSE